VTLHHHCKPSMMRIYTSCLSNTPNTNWPIRVYHDIGIQNNTTKHIVLHTKPGIVHPRRYNGTQP